MPDHHRQLDTLDVTASASQVSSYAMDSEETAGGVEASPVFAPSGNLGELGRLGPYRILMRLGHGGMGEVYLALDERLGRKLALKVMLPKFAANPSAKARFLREARAAAQITHDNVVTVYEADERDGVPFIAMQFLQGYPLDEYLQKKGAPSFPQILAIGRETAAGLAAAHAIGLVHRDIKPGNLWLEAPNGRVKVLDFGLARPVDSQAELTQSGAIIGTPAYMSPEQGRGQKVDGRTDLFSLGAVLYRLCTGRLPFEGSNVMAILTALATEEPTPVRELNPEVPVALAELIHKLLAKRAADRPQTADEVVDLIRVIESDAPTAGPQSTYPQVVYVPMQVTANPLSAFADIATEDSNEVDSPTTPKPARKKSLPWLLIGSVSGFLVCAAMAAVVVIKITNKDGTVTEIRVPDGAKIEVDGKPVGPKKPEPLPTAPDLAAAKWVLSIGGKVRVNGTDQTISAAKELPREAFRLTGIDLIDNKRVLDVDLARFKDSKDLTWLDLAGTDVTDAGLANFADCKKLTHLSLHSGAIGDAGLAHFRDCKDLIELSLTNTKATDAGLANFKDCKKLSTILMGSELITDVGLSNFKGCKDLQSLYLAGTPVSDTGLETFRECSGLSLLYLNGSKITDRSVDQLLGYPKLKILWVQKTKVSAAKYEDLKKALPKCQITSDHGTYEPVDADRKAAEWVLSLGGTVRVDGAERDIANAAELPKEPFRLTRLDLSSNKGLVDADLARVRGCQDLSALYLQGSAVTDAGLTHFENCKKLTTLCLTDTKITDAGLVRFKDCKLLKNLYLGATATTDAGMANFAGCADLTVIYLGRAVGDAGIAHLKGCLKLVNCQLNNTRVGDGSLAFFAECAGLKILMLGKTGISAKGFEGLKAALPKCKIVCDHGAYEPK